MLHSEQIFVKPESYIYDIYNVLNDFILQGHQHGFFKLFESIHFPHEPIVDVQDPRKVLTMSMLSAGFYSWLISIVVACLVFVAEHVVRYYTRTRHLGEVEKFYDELVYDVEHVDNIE